MQSSYTHSEEQGEGCENAGNAVNSVCVHFAFSCFGERYSENIGHPLQKAVWLYCSSAPTSFQSQLLNLKEKLTEAGWHGKVRL